MRMLSCPYHIWIGFLRCRLWASVHCCYLSLGRAYTRRQNRSWLRRYRCWHQYNPGQVYTHTDKIGIGACKAVNFVEWCRAVNMVPMWNRRFYLLCLLHLRRRRRLKRREREFWENPIVAARTLEGAYYTLYGRLRVGERKFCNYFRMSIYTFDYIVDRLAPHLERQNTMMRERIGYSQSLIT